MIATIRLTTLPFWKNTCLSLWDRKVRNDEASFCGFRSQELMNLRTVRKVKRERQRGWEKDESVRRWKKLRWTVRVQDSHPHQ